VRFAKIMLKHIVLLFNGAAAQIVIIYTEIPVREFFKRLTHRCYGAIIIGAIKFPFFLINHLLIIHFSIWRFIPIIFIIYRYTGQCSICFQFCRVFIQIQNANRPWETSDISCCCETWGRSSTYKFGTALLSSYRYDTRVPHVLHFTSKIRSSRNFCSGILYYFIIFTHLWMLLITMISMIWL
jgi:hypothetical protein